MINCPNYKNESIPQEYLSGELVISLENKNFVNLDEKLKYCYEKFIDSIVINQLALNNMPTEITSFDKRRKLHKSWGYSSFIRNFFLNISEKQYKSQYRKVVRYLNKYPFFIQICEDIPYALIFFNRSKDIELEGKPPQAGTDGQDGGEAVEGEEGNYKIFDVVPHTNFKIRDGETWYDIPYTPNSDLRNNAIKKYELPGIETPKVIGIIDNGFYEEGDHNQFGPRRGSHGFSVFQIMANVINNADSALSSENILLSDLNKMTKTHKVEITTTFWNSTIRTTPANVAGGVNGFNLACHIIEMVKNGIKIINLSLGLHKKSLPTYLEKAIQLAINNGILFVTSSGNLCSDNDECPHWLSNFSEESNRFISVGSTNVIESQIEFDSGYSNYGKDTVDICARGNYFGRITISGGNSVNRIVGTSFAAANMTGLLAKYCYGQIQNNKGKEELFEALTGEVYHESNGFGNVRYNVGFGNIK